MTESAISTKAFYMYFIPFKIEFKHDLNHFENIMYKIVSKKIYTEILMNAQLHKLSFAIGIN